MIKALRYLTVVVVFICAPSLHSTSPVYGFQPEPHAPFDVKLINIFNPSKDFGEVVEKGVSVLCGEMEAASMRQVCPPERDAAITKVANAVVKENSLAWREANIGFLLRPATKGNVFPARSPNEKFCDGCGVVTNIFDLDRHLNVCPSAIFAFEDLFQGIYGLVNVGASQMEYQLRLEAQFELVRRNFIGHLCSGNSVAGRFNLIAPDAGGFSGHFPRGLKGLPAGLESFPKQINSSQGEQSHSPLSERVIGGDKGSDDPVPWFYPWVALGFFWALGYGLSCLIRSVGAPED